MQKTEGTMSNIERSTSGTNHPFFSTTIENNVERNYNETKLENKEASSMSLIIMACSKNGIVCASDSKSTVLINSEGQIELEREAQKIFKFEKFIVGTFNYNMIINEKLEDVINKIKNTHYNCTYEEFLDFVKSYLAQKNEYKTYNFIIGTKNKNTYFCKGYCVNAEVIKWDNGYAEAGTSDTYLKNNTKINLMNFNFPYNSTLEDIKNILKKIIEDTIYIGDKILQYNPVGGKIQIETFTISN